ncbi:hypothetical protein HDU96_009282 [Phlyctochytrium bullatum]|nr:hypothetical protein HDU96_009282 [Phlyctochytrium bullatum]
MNSPAPNDCLTLSLAGPFFDYTSPSSCCTSSITGSVNITGVSDNVILCRDGRIVAISFYQRKFNIALPDAIGSLDALEYFSLPSCGISGAIPAAIGSLSNLRLLSLWGNSLTNTIPPELGNLRRLEAMYLTGNRLYGSIPSSLGNLPALETFSINANYLNGSIPSWVAEKPSYQPQIANNCFSNADSYSVSMRSTADCTRFYAGLEVPTPSTSTKSARSSPTSLYDSPTPTPTGPYNTDSTTSAPPIAAIAGGVAGGLVLIALAIAIALWCWKRSRPQSKDARSTPANTPATDRDTPPFMTSTGLPAKASEPPPAYPDMPGSVPATQFHMPGSVPPTQFHMPGSVPTTQFPSPTSVPAPTALPNQYHLHPVAHPAAFPNRYHPHPSPHPAALPNHYHLHPTPHPHLANQPPIEKPHPSTLFTGVNQPPHPPVIREPLPPSSRQDPGKPTLFPKNASPEKAGYTVENGSTSMASQGTSAWGLAVQTGTVQEEALPRYGTLA